MSQTIKNTLQRNPLFIGGATMPEAPKPVSAQARQVLLQGQDRCCFKGKTGAFYGQERRRYVNKVSYFSLKIPVIRRGVVRRITSCKPTPRRNFLSLSNILNRIFLPNTRRPPARRGFLDGAGFLLLLEIFFEEFHAKSLG